MASSGAGVTAAGGNRLTDSPTNLKEAIDWILRVTNKDGQQSGKDAEEYCWCDLANGVTDLLEGVEHHLTEEETKIVKNIIDVLYDVGGTKHVKALIEKVADQLKDFIGWDKSGKKDTLTGKGIGKNNDGRNGNKKYVSHYSEKDKFGDEMAGDDDDDSKVREAKLRCAKILLGCIPFIFSGLSYLYWMCIALNGFRSDGGKGSLPLKHYMFRMGYSWEQWRLVKNTDQVNLNDLIGVFHTCNVLGEKMEDKKQINYAQYLEKLRTSAIAKAEQEKKPEGEWSAITTDTVGPPPHSLLKLNVICSGYFRSLHTIDSIRDPRPRTPNTIREILYWLTSLPYCPIYRTLVPKVQEMFRRVGSGGEVVFYGSNWKGDGTQIVVTPDSCTSYLLGAALVAPLVILCIQDTIECLVGSEKKPKPPAGEKTYKIPDNSDPVPIHDLYANMQFWFSYPMSETQSYYLLQDNLVALFYQLFFLDKQCLSSRLDGEGWGYCKYGDGVKCDEGNGKDGTGCLSWICPVGKKQDHEKNECGSTEKKKASPLQAFLTDCLKGFTCEEVRGKEGYQKNLDKLRKDGEKDINVYNGAYPGFLDHRRHTSVFGTECAVPMGFSGSFRSKSQGGKDMIGVGIYSVLTYYADDNIFVSNLYQITRCICSLTRRVPRSTGTLFGFFYGLGQVAFHRKKKNNTTDDTFKTALTSEMQCCPGYCDPSDLMKALMEWTETDHINKHWIAKGTPGNFTLGSLYMCGDNKTNGSASCGSYLKPLTGSLYNSVSRVYCDTYVSWIVHLSWRLHDGLRSLLDEFRKIDCSTSGCTGKGGRGTKADCCQNGTNHGTKCHCDNVVFCAGVHGLFYRFGFTYNSPGYVAYTQKRKCDKFYKQLEKVIKGALFTNLQTQLRKFIYSTRALFGLYIGVYWTAVIVYLLWSLGGPLDLLHIQSHWRSPRSHLVPLQRILADGSRNIKGVCTIGYFQENSGDRLLSQGVSDVYL